MLMAKMEGWKDGRKETGVNKTISALARLKEMMFNKIQNGKDLFLSTVWRGSNVKKICDLSCVFAN